MIFGYTPYDPLVVLLGTVMALRFLIKRPVRLVPYLPTALSLYFFIPTVTLLTLWQTVPMLLTARLLVLQRLRLPAGSGAAVIAVCSLAIIGSAAYAVTFGDDITRALIRVVYYLGILALFSFCYEMGRRPEAYELLLKGFVIIGIVYALYGLYQIIAMKTGLPVRGILRGTHAADMAYEYGLVRINSLANEPKRLGYVMFLSVLACIFLAQIHPKKATRLRGVAIFILAMSLFTFSGSYFFAIAIFVGVALVLYPTRITGYAALLLALGAPTMGFFSESGFLDALQYGYERRLEEVEIGLDGTRVYRQEFYAWDYLEIHPITAVLGVGMGQYFIELYQAYGPGVGIDGLGNLVPMNSTFLETVYDLGGLVAILLYFSLALLIWRLRQAGETFLCLGLLFLTVQSLTVLTLQFIVVFAGMGLSRLKALNVRKPKSHGRLSHG